MTRIALRASSWAPLLALVISCANDEARTHVYTSSPPRPGTPAAPVLPSASAASEPPVGSTGPAARVVSVRLASTGEAAQLERLSESVEIMTLVSRGRGSSSAGPARIELRITGAIDTTLVERLSTPVPIVVAHSFRLGAADGSLGLPSGRYQLQVRLVRQTDREIASPPISIGVARR